MWYIVDISTRVAADRLGRSRGPSRSRFDGTKAGRGRELNPGRDAGRVQMSIAERPHRHHKPPFSTGSCPGASVRQRARAKDALRIRLQVKVPRSLRLVQHSLDPECGGSLSGSRQSKHRPLGNPESLYPIGTDRQYRHCRPRRQVDQRHFHPSSSRCSKARRFIVTTSRASAGNRRRWRVRSRAPARSWPTPGPERDQIPEPYLIGLGGDGYGRCDLQKLSRKRRRYRSDVIAKLARQGNFEQGIRIAQTPSASARCPGELWR